MPQYTLHIVPHTHWDREWFGPFQRYRVQLVRLLDEVLSILERDPNYSAYTLDGQTIPVVDYLEIRPEKADLIASLVSRRRLLIGPWYVLPDEFMVSGESHVRNLMLGHRIARDFGFLPKMGYIPDAFGHMSQMPQILRGFGIDNAMLWRGLSRPGLKSELWWEAPDGTRVLLNYLLPYTGYSSAAQLPEEFERAEAYLKSLSRAQRRRATTCHLLAQNGVDHAYPRAELSSLIQFLNVRAEEDGEDLRYAHSSLLDYIESVKSEVDPEALEVVEGELRSTNWMPNQEQHVLPNVLPNVLSSRIYNKIQNADAQQALERWAEPWSAFLWSLGEEYPRSLLWRSWDWLIQNHPHDSIGGCSVDDVHDEMETRFQWSQQIADTLTDERFRLLAARLDLSWLEDDALGVVLFNGLGWPVQETVTVDLDIPHNFWARRIVERSAREEIDWDAETSFHEVWEREWRRVWEGDPPRLPKTDFKGLSLCTVDGEELPLEIEDVQMTETSRTLLHGPSASQPVVRVRTTFPVELPAYGYRVLSGRLMSKPNRHDAPAHPTNVMANEYLRVEIQATGTLRLLDKSTGYEYTDLGYFEDGGDCGDGYNYSPPPHDAVMNTLSISPRVECLVDGPAVQRYRISYELALPVGLTEDRKRRRTDRVACPLTVVVSLGANARRVDFQATFENRAKDHRLRVLFPSDVTSEVSYSDTPFDVVAHAIHPPQPPRHIWVEDEPVTYPQQTFVDLSDGERGLCVMTHGLPEYQVIDSPRREVAITLMRSVAYMSGADYLYTALHGAGPHIATPGAQCLRTITYRYALMPHAGTWEEAEVWRESHAHSVRPRAIVVEKDPGFPIDAAANPEDELPNDWHSLLSVEGTNAVLSTVKRAEREPALIVRLYNPGSEPTVATVRVARPFSEAKLVNLDEEPLGETLVTEDSHSLDVELGPKKIVTLRLDE